MPKSHENTEAALEEIRDRTVWSLTTDADCLTPDRIDSEGAHFLRRVRDAVLDLYGEISYDTAAEFFDEANDRRYEISDAAPSIYTHTLWLQFVDLGAYFEDPTELGADASDMNKAASTALYMIADRLADALLNEIFDAIERDEQDDDDDETEEV